MTKRTIEIELTPDEVQFLIDHAFAEDYMERMEPSEDAEAVDGLVGTFTIEELDDLLGTIAAEANHARSRKIEAKLDRLFRRLEAKREAGCR